ncbi:MAG: endolytic transglycosylase MltG [Chloroflexi bacterium]|nr:endolytic transglycosylase MltG [Chloroflexota bacterium]
MLITEGIISSRQKVRQDPYEEKSKPFKWLTCLVRVGLLFLVVVGCGTAVFVLYGQWLRAGQNGVVIEGGNPNLNLAERLYLQMQLANQADQLQQPAGTAVGSIPFTVGQGETADVIAANLVQAQLLTDAELFTNYVRYYGLDAELEAGEFVLSGDLTIPELATALTRAYAAEFTITFIEGWRLEEMADQIALEQPALINADDFLAIVRGERPFDLSQYDFLVSHLAGVTLEGYLFPDTYLVPADADAAYLVNLMLQNFGKRVTPEMRQAFGVQGVSLREAVTLASIVEREAVVAEERPLIAGVFYNRLAQSIKLDADPTIQYPLGYQEVTESWWKSPLFQADLELDNPYNTYIYTGLPPGPIANPGLSALQAVASPTPSDFIFFVADCAADGTHLFSVTYEEHLANVSLCQ